MKNHVNRWMIYLCLLGLVGTAMGSVVFNDTFDVGASPTVGDDGDDPNDMAWVPYATGPSISVQDDSGNNVLSYTSTTSYRGFLTDVSPVTISAGESINLSFVVRSPSGPTTAACGFRFALQNSAGAASSYGYVFCANFDSDSTLGGIYESSKSSGFGASGQFVASSDCSITGTDWHTFNATITRIDDTHLSFTYGMDGVNYADSFVYEDSAPTFTFDTIGIGEGGTTQAFLVDNIQLNVVPEATTLTLFGSAALGLLILRKGHVG